jgi:hypothetical protein
MESHMISAASLEEKLMWQLKCALPLPARGRPALQAYLRDRAVEVRHAPRLTVTNIFHAGEAKGLMCQFTIEGAAAGKSEFVASMQQLAFDRRHPITREIAAYRKRSADRVAIN